MILWSSLRTLVHDENCTRVPYTHTRVTVGTKLLVVLVQMCEVSIHTYTYIYTHTHLREILDGPEFESVNKRIRVYYSG